MASPRGTAVYKKKEGILTVTDDQISITWTPQTAPGGPPVVTLAIANITSRPSRPLAVDQIQAGPYADVAVPRSSADP